MTNKTKDIEQMLQINNGKKDSVYINIYRTLRELIVTGKWAKGEKIMSEAELAKIMGVGRTSLRSALVILSEDGYIKTYQGKGTFVIYDPDGPKESFASSYMLPDKRLKRKKGKTISYSATKVHDVGNDGYLDEVLRANGGKILMLKRGYLLNDAPAILSFVFIRADVLDGSENMSFEENYSKFKTIFHDDVAYINNILSPIPSINMLNKFFKAESKIAENILLSTATLYNMDDEPVAFIKDYYDTREIEYRIKMFK